MTHISLQLAFAQSTPPFQFLHVVRGSCSAMADQGNSQVMSRHDSSFSSVPRDSLRPSRRDDDFSKDVSKRSYDGSDGLPGKRQCPSPQPGSSQQPDGSPHRSTVNVSVPDHKLDLLTNLLHGLVGKLDQRNAPYASSSRQGDFSRYHDMSSSGSDTEEIREEEINDPDPLDGFGGCPPHSVC
ncbi:hypothetical protein E2C01_018816 [Portunus trituberculatus]|uniref:Uncharacterized protein n=1 Tax=Portunus trituberculatus TaxID=210409 RepID=A0A5B7DXK9_PORTR|nr:hypothetical protein [Portunus trituberculatus]